MFRLPHYGGLRLALAVLAASSGVTAVQADDPILWRTDYATACKEATAKGLPIFVEVGTDTCFYCRKQHATTFVDPAVASVLNTRFIPLKVDATRNPAFADALRVTSYPTSVIAAPGGKILVYHAGYLSAEQFHEKAKVALPADGKGG